MATKETKVIISAETSKYERGMRDMKLKTIRTNKAIKSSFKTVSTSMLGMAGVATSLAGTTAVALSSIVKTGAGFESQMATVKGVMRATENDFNALTDIAKEMGETTEWSATQSAQALNYMGMAGFSADQSISALPGVLDLATAGGIDLGMASNIVTDSLTAMGMEVSELSRLNDVMVGTITRSNTTVEMLGESFKYVAPIAHSMNYEVEELSAMLGTLANAGIKASDAGTDLRQGMIKNIKVSKILGTKHNDLIGTLIAAKEAGWGVNEITENYGLLASKSMLVLMDQIDVFRKLEEQLHNVAGETKKLADIKLNTLTGSWKEFKSAIEGTQLIIYDNLKNPLDDSVKSATKLVQALNKVLKAAEPIFTGVIHGGILGGIFETAKMVGASVANLAGGEKPQIITGKVGESAYIDSMVGVVDNGKEEPVTTKTRDPGSMQKTDDSKEIADASNMLEWKQHFATASAEILQSEIDREQEMKRSARDVMWAEQEVLEARKLEITEGFNQQYAEMGLSRLEVERQQLEAEKLLWEQAGIDKSKINQLVGNRSVDIAKTENQAKLGLYEKAADSISNTFKIIADAGGKHSKKAFQVYKAFAMVEATIAGVRSVLAALASAPPPYSFILAGIAGAAAAVQIAQISAQQPPSYDQGGISNAKGVYQTGNIAEAHIPIPSGGKIPVKVDDGGQQPVQIIMQNPVFQDVETQREVFAQIADVVARRVAPDAVVENYANDGTVRNMVRSRQ